MPRGPQNLADFTLYPILFNQRGCVRICMPVQRTPLTAISIRETPLKVEAKNSTI